MPTLAEIHDADMAVILADAGEVFTFGGTDYACIVSERSSTKELEEGGFMLDYDFLIVTRKSLFATAPALGQTVTYRGVTHRIVRVAPNYSDKILNLSVKTDAR